MPDTVAQRLAVAAVWPVAVQRLLIASPDLRDALVVNEHLDPDVVDTLANTSTPTGLRRLIQSQRHGVDGMRACLRHAHEMFGPATPDGSEEIDFEVAWALLHGDGPERVRALDAALATARTGHSTAEVRYAARVDRPAVELVADMELHERALWLASPAAADLSDPVVWELAVWLLGLHRRHQGQGDGGDGR